jgi:hypothetical protein
MMTFLLLARKALGGVVLGSPGFLDIQSRWPADLPCLSLKDTPPNLNLGLKIV